MGLAVAVVARRAMTGVKSEEKCILLDVDEEAELKTKMLKLGS